MGKLSKINLSLLTKIKEVRRKTIKTQKNGIADLCK